MIIRRGSNRSPSGIGDWWSLLIVRDAFDGMRRFSEFQKSLGIAKGILAARLRRLVELGVLELVPATDGSAFHEYRLTEKGRGLFLVVVGLRQWGEDHLFHPSEPRSALIDITSGQAVGRLTLPGTGGQPLGPDNTMVRKLTAG